MPGKTARQNGFLWTKNAIVNSLVPINYLETPHCSNDWQCDVNHLADFSA